MSRNRRVVVIGAGVGGLTAALQCAAAGLDTLVVEQAAAPGGKLREVEVEGRVIDAGPTVFTMRDVFEDIFASVGESLSDHLALTRAGRLARHAWGDGSRLDLFGDTEANVEAIGDFAGADEARGYREFAARSARVFATLDDTFVRASRPGLLSLMWRVGLTRIADLAAISPYQTLWDAVGEHFRDSRLRQLFGRYSTYCGASPFEAPATLMLVAHVERQGVWYVEGGMRRLADALMNVAVARGARFLFDTCVTRLVVENGRARGVMTHRGERFEADAIVFNGDVSALGAGLFGDAAKRAAPATPPGRRSLSALTWLGLADVEGFELIRHNVVFGADYRQEFEAIFKRRNLPREPTVYICASDRGDGGAAISGPERVFCLVNAPAEAGASLTPEELERCESAATTLMLRCGLKLNWRRRRSATPTDFARRFPATGGALYGLASHGWRASFRRPGARSRLPGLYLAGGSVHPGPGVPMAALSGRQAALALMADLASISRYVPAVMPGGISTPSATTAGTD